MTISSKDKEKEIQDLGCANSWAEAVPEPYKQCNHPAQVDKLSRCYNRYTCNICRITYTIDSSD